ncbi:hypothetical protein K438DRAFT_386396 [Mycena galopus ATCC 62051]|nr:hypothetical protein K438DRAFT_386396 [Mycena galopus ATCC 62051]
MSLASQLFLLGHSDVVDAKMWFFSWPGEEDQSKRLYLTNTKHGSLKVRLPQASLQVLNNTSSSPYSLNMDNSLHAGSVLVPLWQRPLKHSKLTSAAAAAFNHRSLGWNERALYPPGSSRHVSGSFTTNTLFFFCGRTTKSKAKTGRWSGIGTSGSCPIQPFVDGRARAPHSARFVRASVYGQTSKTKAKAGRKPLRGLFGSPLRRLLWLHSACALVFADFCTI